MSEEIDEARAWCAEERPSVAVGLRVAVKDVCVGEAAMIGSSRVYFHATCLLLSEYHGNFEVNEQATYIS